MTRWALTFTAPRAYPPYELIAGERTVIGRALILTWDGALMRLPPRATSTGPRSDPLIHHILAIGGGDEALFSCPPDRLAELVRALFPHAWRKGRETREQLDAPDDDGVRWLLDRAKPTAVSS